MKKVIVSVVTVIIILLGSNCIASQPAIIGGMRDGAALGLMLENGPTKNATLRLGFEAHTSNTPGIIFIGGKWFHSNVNYRYPMFLSGGLVGYLGNITDVGPYVSVIFENLLDVKPLFLEIGLDVVRYGRFQFQVGYYWL